MKFLSLTFVFLISATTFFVKEKGMIIANKVGGIKATTSSSTEPLKITSFHFKVVSFSTKKILSETDAVCIFSFYNDLRIVRIKYPEGSLGYKITNYQGLNKEDSTELNWTVEDKTVIGYKLISPKTSAPTLYEFRSDETVLEYTELQIEFPK